MAHDIHNNTIRKERRGNKVDTTTSDSEEEISLDLGNVCKICGIVWGK